MLLAKLRHMTAGSSPVSGPRGRRRLVPELCDSDPEGAGPPDQSPVTAQISLPAPQEAKDLAQELDE